MKVAPLNEEIYGLYATVRGCRIPVFLSGCDWFIRVCEPYAKNHPSNTALMKTLVEIAIQKEYYDMACEWISLISNGVQTDYLRYLLTGDLEYARGNAESAYRLWEKIKPEDARGQYEAGERFNRAQEYEKAITCYQNSFSAEHPPKHLDAVYALAFLYKKLGRYAEAVQAWQTIIDVYASDYGITDGESIDWPLREIQKLKTDR